MNPLPRECDNPHYCSEAYVPACPPEECAPKQCVLRSDDVSVPVAPPTQAPETPNCLVLVYATNGDEEVREFGYQFAQQQYSSDDGSTIVFTPSVGWTLTTNFNTYSRGLGETNPVGVYTSADNQVISLVDCDTYVAPDQDEFQCIKLVFAERSSIQRGVFRRASDQFTSDRVAGVIIFVNNRWEFSVDGETYNGPSSILDPTGEYVSDQGLSVFFKRCTEAEEAGDTCDTLLIVQNEW